MSRWIVVNRMWIVVNRMWIVVNRMWIVVTEWFLAVQIMMTLSMLLNLGTSLVLVSGHLGLFMDKEDYVNQFMRASALWASCKY